MENLFQLKKPAINLDGKKPTQPQQLTTKIKTMNPDNLDRDFYCKAYKDVKPRFCDPYIHYYNTGIKEDRLPNANKFEQLYPEFDAVVYATNNGDLTNFTPEELMSHFHHHGKNEGRLYTRTATVPKIILKPKDPQHKKHKQPIIQKQSQSQSQPIISTPPIDDPIQPIEKYIDTNNFKKIDLYKDHIEDIYLPQILHNVVTNRDSMKPVYLILSEWGYPPFGGGEWWLIDTAKWMNDCGFACYYIYFSDPSKNSDFDQYEVNDAEFCTYIKFLRDNVRLLKFMSLLNPSVISHQGLRRMEYLKIANLFEKPFITGFCFWQDIIKMPPSSKDIFNQNMLNKTFTPDENFGLIHKNAAACYVASPFMAEIVKKVHNIDAYVINTISDESQYKFIKPENDVYVTVVNICGLKGGNILEAVINNTALDIPFLLIDSQESECEVNKQLKKLLIERNSVENPHKSVYIKGSVADMKHIYRQTRILLIPSLVDESFCRVAYEGMMNSLPILSTTNGNLKHVLSGYADFLSTNPTDWYTKINQIYADDGYLKSMRNRSKTIDPSIDQNKFINLVYRSIMSEQPNYSIVNRVGILCPWADQGLGIQCREYYDILQKCGYIVSIYSFKPYHSTQKNQRLQADPSEWNYENIYYSSNVREEIDAEDFINYLHRYKVNKMIIVETCYPKVFELAKICNMLSIQVAAIPNLETLRYSEIHKHDVFDKIICNNQMTYDILSKYYPYKATLMGFRILNKNFGIDKKWSKFSTMFCSGGLNSLSRKNIDKIIYAFKELENENKIGNFKLYVYIQGVEIPQHIDRFKSNNIIFSVTQKSYKEIVDLYKKHDIFIHMGDHEGLGLGFYESIACGTPVFTIDTQPNNEIIHDSVNGWLVRCNYAPLNDNKEGIIRKAAISVPDIKAKLYEIITTYNREGMMQSTIMDYVNRYPISVYSEQIKKMFS